MILDCTVFVWETDTVVPLGTARADPVEARARMRKTLRLVYSVSDDDSFEDLVRALDSAGGAE